MSDTARCLITLEPLPTEGYARAAMYRLAGARVVLSPRLDFRRDDVVRYRSTTMRRMSISGVQDKVSIRLERGRLAAVERDGTHLLKPIPSLRLPQHHQDVPANEHLTMLIAEQVFGITTAACGLIRLADGELAYLTRRFDRLADGSKLGQEDAGQLAGRSVARNGPNYKYDSSYETIGRLIATHCSAVKRDLIEFFRRVLFCYALGNGDAHLRNFSILHHADGLVELSPAYDLLNTHLHLPTESELALTVFDDDFQSPAAQANGCPAAADFTELGRRLGLGATAIERELARHGDPKTREQIAVLVRTSFLGREAQEQYLGVVTDQARKLLR
jgi:serine/threonine-protein kinase HipA